AIKPKTIDEVLTRFGLKKISAAKITRWKIPSYRRDLQRDVDLIEEVVRAYGAERIPGTDRSLFTPSSAADRAHDLESQIRERPSGAEKKRVAILLWGNLGNEVHWRNEKRPLDFFDLKSAIELTRNDKLSYQRGLKNRNMALTVDILTNHDLIGVAGQLSNALSSKLDASGGVFVAEVS